MCPPSSTLSVPLALAPEVSCVQDMVGWTERQAAEIDLIREIEAGNNAGKLRQRIELQRPAAGEAAGGMVEIAMIGRDSIAGGSSALDGKIALNRVMVQIAGAGSVLDLEHLRGLAATSDAFRTALIRYDQLILVQAQQSAACNVSHTMARYLRRPPRPRPMQKS